MIPLEKVSKYTQSIRCRLRPGGHLVECTCADLKTAFDELLRLKGNGLWEDISAIHKPSHDFQISKWGCEEG